MASHLPLHWLTTSWLILVGGCTNFLSDARLEMMGGAEPSAPPPNSFDLAAVLRDKPNTTLIVGCGKNPSAWQPTTSEGTNTWKEEQAQGLTGEHTHPGCVTLAEDPSVEPDIVWDWTEPIPKEYHEKFAEVYLEKLPPAVLEQPTCMKNLFDALKPGKWGAIDFQVRTVKGEAGSDIIGWQSPFSLSLPPLKTLKERQDFRTLMYTLDIVGVPQDLNARSAHVSSYFADKYRSEAEEKVKKDLQEIGFCRVVVRFIPRNKYNKRNGYIIQVKKPAERKTPTDISASNSR